MSAEPSNGAGTDDRLQDILVAYLEAREAGGAPDREALLLAHPEFAAELKEFFATDERVGGAIVPLRRAVLGDPGANGGAPATGEIGLPAGLTQLGDFRIIREVGRGGMGVVYEAEQVSLKRRVALKVLPLAATLGGTQLQRFHNEARAAAGLHHTNIVPVHFVGCESGIHFYVMQYIDGQSLAAVVSQLRRPADRATSPQAADTPTTAHVPSPAPGEANGTGSTQPAALLSTAGGARGREYFRAVAELGVQAAEALDYGHRVGVVHRDIKPGNLLLDGAGRLWVTDFGLAHVQGTESMTATGELVGTLRYMSPEQALAKRVVIDHRTDVYSLGATFYELLTLRPPFGGTDRHELLRQIAFEEPRPPRRLNKAVPAELETVVLKAMEKAPQDRYATAQGLADDLRRWLDDRPIQARRPSVVQRLRKWAWRHRAAVNAAAVCLLIVVTVVAGTIGWGVRDRQTRRNEAMRRAREALENAAACVQDENWPEGLRAVEQAEGFLASFEEGTAPGLQARLLRRDLVMAGRLQEARLQGTALKDGHFDGQAIDAAYAGAFGGYGLELDGLDPLVAAEQVRARPIRRQLVAALDEWATIRKGLKREGWRHRLAVARAADPDGWRNRLRDALEGKDPKALEEVVAADPAGDWPPPTLMLLGDLARGTASAERVAVLLGRAQQRNPGDFWINETLGDLLHYSQPARLNEEICYYTAAVALRPQSPGAHNNLGIALTDKGRLDEAIAEFREALRLNKDYAMAHSNLGAALAKEGRLDEASAECREAISLRKDLPHAHGNLGTVLAQQGRLDEAEAEFREALRLKKDIPEAHTNLGNLLAEKGRLEEAIAEYRETIRLNKDFFGARVNLGNALKGKGRLDEAIAEFREAIRLKKDFPLAHCNLGDALRQKGRLDEAIAEFREAIRIKKDYAEAHCNLGVALRAKGQLDEAIAEYREAVRLKKDFPEAHSNLGNLLAEKGRLDEAIAEYREAVRLQSDFALGHCNLGRVLLAKGQFRQAVEEIRRGHELGSRNPRWPYPSAQLLRQAEQLADLDARLAALLKGQKQPKDASERLALAQFCQEHKQLFAAAARWYGEAFAAQPALADDLRTGSRYNAACAAALAGCGQGKEAGNLDNKERTRLRKQALDWLRADLAAWRRLLEKVPGQDHPAIAQQLAHWLEDTDFASVRGEQDLAKLPEAERKDWQKLWAEVAGTLARAQGKPTPATKPDTKPPPGKAAAGHDGA